MEDYAIEDGEEVDLTKLRVGFIEREKYIPIHANSVIPCHDVFIELDEGFLLVKRLEFPAKGEWWPLGGKIDRGSLN